MSDDKPTLDVEAVKRALSDFPADVRGFVILGSDGEPTFVPLPDSDSMALRDLADALRARCPSCGAAPVLQVRHDFDPPRLYLDCQACHGHSVDGGEVHADDLMLSGLRVVGRIWLRYHRGDGGE